MIRSSLVEVSTSDTAVVPDTYSLVIDTRPVPPRLHSAAAVVRIPSEGYTPLDARRTTAFSSVSQSTSPVVSPALAITDERK